jgi:amino acid transporter
VLTARIVYGMARSRVLPPFLGTVSSRFATPVTASIIVGLLLIGITWVYLLATSVQIWSLVGIIAAGLVLMLYARFVLRSEFFQVQRESDLQER